jgi:hypothetical protein
MSRLEDLRAKLPSELVKRLEELLVPGKVAPVYPGLDKAIESDYFTTNYPTYKNVEEKIIRKVAEDYLTAQLFAKQETLISAGNKLASLAKNSYSYLYLLNGYQETISFEKALRMEYPNIPTKALDKMINLMNNQEELDSYGEHLDFFNSLVDIYNTR